MKIANGNPTRYCGMRCVGSGCVMAQLTVAECEQLFTIAFEKVPRALIAV